MTETDNFSAAQGTGIINAGVAVGIDQHHRAGARKGADDSEVSGIASGEDDGTGAVEKGRQLLLQCEV
ncbi:hypothetical protein SRABI106_01808 [Rahnella aquatilis]|nr:hypothetical protein SRABI106_01808 [Rahnella aquatilis]